ncbi:hypothetical protein D3C72_1411230 [compost metagenome]
MAQKYLNIKTAFVLAFSTLTIIAFQNCSKVNFSEDQNSAIFKTSSDDSVVDPGVSEVPPAEQIPEDSVEEDDVDYDSLVECELISPKQKIIFDQVLSEGSNKSATRVCMSENACLKVINSYAAKRDCKLSLGASSLQDSESQCTRIFPGSKGTCRNAGVVSDEKVAEVLDLMGKSK